MEVLKTKNGIVLEVQVKPRSRRFRIQANHKLVVFCRQLPFGGKVNQELIKELSKTFGRRVQIISGFRSRTKKILIRDAAEEEIMKALEFLKKGK